MGSMLFLVLVIVLVSGLIAYIGDLVGRKMGRKRLTLWGLRPKHTAIVISVGVGMLIAILTLASIFTISRSIREAFFTLDKLRADLKQQRQAVQATRAQLDAARTQAADAERQLQEKIRKLDEINTRLQGYISQRDRIQQQLTHAQDDLRKAQQHLHATQRLLDDNTQRLQKAKADYALVQADLKRAKENLVSTSNQIHKLQDEQYRLQEDVRALNDRVQVLGLLAKASFVPLAFATGQEILSGVIPTNGSDASRETALASFFTTAEQVIRQRCPELPQEASALVFLGGTDEHPQKITRKAAISLLAARIKNTDASRQVIVRLSPVNNVPVNGQALIAVETIELIPNDRVFVTGEEIARIEVAGGAKETAKVLGSLADDLLRVRVPEALRAKKMVMITRRFDPEHPETIPGSSQAIVSWADLLTTAERAAAQPGKVSIVARAKTALYRYDPVNISLEVVPAPTR